MGWGGSELLEKDLHQHISCLFFSRMQHLISTLFPHVLLGTIQCTINTVRHGREGIVRERSAPVYECFSLSRTCRFKTTDHPALFKSRTLLTARSSCVVSNSHRKRLSTVQESYTPDCQIFLRSI